ncbi:hypothetical protein ACFSX5_10695 [Devosia albogilva]|uniref:DUF4268 domain-containing protein n=1 Tax=Devosia albogilva TaxID=429726 RepID=A0ABW5QKU5_9HYPH
MQQLQFDDPEQVIPKPTRLGYCTFALPAPGSWLTAYREVGRGRVGLFLSSAKNSPGEAVAEIIASEWDSFKDELGPSAELTKRDGRYSIGDALQVRSLHDPAERDRAFQWLAGRLNTYVNVLRPRVRSALADHMEEK